MGGCCVPRCKNRSETCVRQCDSIVPGANGTRKLKLHRFPRDLYRKQLWMNKIQRPDWVPKESSKICEMHFERTEYEELENGLLKLRKDAIPTIFNHYLPDPLALIETEMGRLEYRQNLDALRNDHDYLSESMRVVPKKKPSFLKVSRSGMNLTFCRKKLS